MIHARFGPDAAGGWRQAASSPRARWVAAAIGVAGLAVGVVGAPEVGCSPLSPCTQGDVDSFGVFLGLFVLSLTGLWLWPTAGALFGLAAGLVDAAYDPSSAARVVFAAYAVACLNVLVALRRSRRSQREVLDGIPKQPVVAGDVPVVASGREVWSAWLWLGAAGGVLVTLLSVVVFVHGKAGDAAHRDVAALTTGTVVTGWDDGLRQLVALDQVGLPEQVWVFASSELPPGTSVRLLVDPADPEWAELPHDPLHHSAGLGWALISGGLSLGALALIAKRRRAATRPLSDGVAMEVSVSASGQATLRPVGGAPVATFLTGRPSPLLSRGGRRRRIDWAPGVVVGDLRDWGWVTVFTDAGAITPATPVRTVRAEDLALRPTGLASLDRGWQAVTDRLPIRAVGTVLIGFALATSGAVMLPDAIAVAQGRGMPGTLTITSESCAKSCSYSGDFRSTDGFYVFRDVFFSGSGAVGERLPAVYVGSGEVPEEVYEPGTGALLESGFFSLVGLGVASWPFAAVVLDASSRRGRHA